MAVGPRQGVVDVLGDQRQCQLLLAGGLEVGDPVFVGGDEQRAGQTLGGRFRRFQERQQRVDDVGFQVVDVDPTLFGLFYPFGGEDRDEDGDSAARMRRCAGN